MASTTPLPVRRLAAAEGRTFARARSRSMSKARRSSPRPAMVRRLLAASCIPAAVLLAGCNSQPAPATAANTPPTQDANSAIERGKVLVTVGGCNDCHTPKTMGPNGPVPDTSKLLSGHPEGAAISEAYQPANGSPWTIATNDLLTAWSGPWGISFATNLTPDPNTGLRSGVWTEQLFIQAMRTGKHMGTSRAILPPMPWQELSQLSDDDLHAIWEYLGSIPPVANHVPDPIPPAPPGT